MHNMKKKKIVIIIEILNTFGRVLYKQYCL